MGRSSLGRVELMHEISIAQSVLDIAFRESETRAATHIRRIKLSIGEFSGVVKEALEFAFEVLQVNTLAADAAVEIEVIPMTATCSKCGPTECRLNDLNLLCPTCGGTLIVRTGREMQIDYLDID